MQNNNIDNNNYIDKNYNGLSDESDVELLNEIVDELYGDGDGLCGISEVCSVICGKEYYSKWNEEDLEYVKEVMEELRGVKVEFDLENECMYVVDEVEN